MKAYETWLPCFPGFYESWLYNDEDETRAFQFTVDALFESFTREKLPAELVQKYLSDHFFDESMHSMKFGYPQYTRDCAVAFCDVVQDAIDGALELRSQTRVVFQGIKSPKTYNFETDSVNCKILTNWSAVLRYCREHGDAFAHYLERYKSRDGFWSYYSPDVADWMDPDAMWTEHHPGAVLDFILRDNLGEDADYLLCQRVLESVHLADYVDLPDGLEDFLKTDAFAKLAAEFTRGIEQGEEYLRQMHYSSKARGVVDQAKRDWLQLFSQEMTEAIEARDAGEEIA